MSITILKYLLGIIKKWNIRRQVKLLRIKFIWPKSVKGDSALQKHIYCMCLLFTHQSMSKWYFMYRKAIFMTFIYVH